MRPRDLETEQRQRARILRTVGGAIVAAAGVAIFVVALVRDQAQWAQVVPLLLIGFGLGVAQPELMAKVLRIVTRQDSGDQP